MTEHAPPSSAHLDRLREALAQAVDRCVQRLEGAPFGGCGAEILAVENARTMLQAEIRRLRERS